MTITDDQKKYVKNLLVQGEQIEAARFLKTALGISLKEAVELVEKLEETEEVSSVTQRSKNDFFQNELKSSKHLGKKIGIGFILIGLIMLGVATYFIVEDYQFAQKAVSVDGKVVRIAQDWSTDDDGNSTLMYSPVFEYIYNDSVFTHNSNVSSSGNDFEIGEEVEVLVDPEAPGKALVNAFWERWFAVVILGVMGSMFTGMGYMAFRLM